MPDGRPQDRSSAVARSLSVVGERWALLIVREALYGVTRFETFRVNLGIAPDVLGARLATFVEHGIMTREAYRQPGRRTYSEYLLTETGRDLQLVVGALQQWGDAHMPRPEGPSVGRRSRITGERVRVGFVDGGHEVAQDDIDVVPVGKRILYLTWLQWAPEPAVNERH
jgi:DNA-binding HxlR family transcriptional regulator